MVGGLEGTNVGKSEGLDVGLRVGSVGAEFVAVGLLEGLAVGF